MRAGLESIHGVFIEAHPAVWSVIPVGKIIQDNARESFEDGVLVANLPSLVGSMLFGSDIPHVSILMHFCSNLAYAFTSSSLDSGFRVTCKGVSRLHVVRELSTYNVGRHDVFRELVYLKFKKVFGYKEKW